MCPQLMSAWAAWRAWERWSGRSGANEGRRRRGGAPSGGPTVRRIWGISVDGVGADGVRTTALSVHSSMHTQHELMSTEGLPGLPRRRGHGAEAKCGGELSSELSRTFKLAIFFGEQKSAVCLSVFVQRIFPHNSMRRFSAPLAVLILAATLADARRFPLEVTSGADSLSHTASSGSTKLAVNSDQGHNLQVADSNIVEVTSSGVAVTGTLTQSNKAYVYGSVASTAASTISGSLQDISWSSATANGAMSWSNNKDFTPTNSGLYKVSCIVSVYLDSAASDGERALQLALRTSSTYIVAGISHVSIEDSSTTTYSQVVIGPVVVSLTGGTAYNFGIRSLGNGHGIINDGGGTGNNVHPGGNVYNSFLVESFP